MASLGFWRYFTLAEFACKHCKANEMTLGFITKIDALRRDVGFALPVSSGYRCPEHNARVSSTGRTGPHTTGRAVDFAVQGEQAHILILVALKSGFTGLGVQQKGGGRFIHLDDLSTGRPTVWSY